MANNDTKFFDSIIKYWQKIQKYVAIILLFIVFICSLLNIPFGQYSAAFAIALIMVNALFSIYEHIKNEDKRISFVKFHDAALHWRDSLEKELIRGKTIHIKFLGLTMDYGSPFIADLLQYINKKYKDASFTIEVVMLDPNWSELGNLNETWPFKAPTSLNTLKLAFNKCKRNNSNAILEIFLYNHIPNWHGFTINDRYVYFSRCSFIDGQIIGGENPYQLIDSNKDDNSQEDIIHFLSWFDFCKKTRVSFE